MIAGAGAIKNTTVLRGLTWDHPRATTPLYAAQAPMRVALPDVEIRWDAQPLASFEFRPMHEIVAGYDLVIFDHPHVGEIAAHGLMRPLDALVTAEGLADTDFVGPSLASYRLDSHYWGLPLDAACQVACARPDLLTSLGEEAPRSWSQVLALGGRAGQQGMQLAIGLGGVHALMTLLTLCANQGAPLAPSPGVMFADLSAVRAALEAMRALCAFCPPEVLGWNSIDALNAMTTRDDLVYCPCVYGFVPYVERARPRRLAFMDLPGLAAPHCAGSTIGGAGIGISSCCVAWQQAQAAVAFLVRADVQTDVIAANQGQPARSAAWESSAINAASDDFFRNTRATIEQSWVRPRFNGYLKFQKAGGAIVEHCLRGQFPADAAIDRLEAEWVRAVTV